MGNGTLYNVPLKVVTELLGQPSALRTQGWCTTQHGLLISRLSHPF